MPPPIPMADDGGGNIQIYYVRITKLHQQTKITLQLVSTWKMGIVVELIKGHDDNV